MVNNHLEVFDEFNKIDAVQFKAMKKEIRKGELADNQAERKQEEILARERLRQ